MKRLFGVCFFILALAVSFIVGPSFADEAKPSCLKGIEFLSGFATSNIKGAKNYNFVPLFVDFVFDIKTLAQKIGIKYWGVIEFIEEPAISYAYNPNSNVEFANNFLLKIGLFRESVKLQPYLKGGAGIVYITQHGLGQGSQFNFNEYLGAGIQYFFTKSFALTAEYRYRHLSNSGIAHPNDGVDTQMGLAGVSYRF